MPDFNVQRIVPVEFTRKTTRTAFSQKMLQRYVCVGIHTHKKTFFLPKNVLRLGFIFGQQLKGRKNLKCENNPFANKNKKCFPSEFSQRSYTQWCTLCLGAKQIHFLETFRNLWNATPMSQQKGLCKLWIEAFWGSHKTPPHWYTWSGSFLSELSAIFTDELLTLKKTAQKLFSLSLE
jgi:hypothetical protein